MAGIRVFVRWSLALGESIVNPVEKSLLKMYAHLCTELHVVNSMIPFGLFRHPYYYSPTSFISLPFPKEPPFPISSCDD